MKIQNIIKRGDKINGGQFNISFCEAKIQILFKNDHIFFYFLIIFGSKTFRNTLIKNYSKVYKSGPKV